MSRRWPVPLTLGIAGLGILFGIGAWWAWWLQSTSATRLRVGPVGGSELTAAAVTLAAALLSVAVIAWIHRARAETRRGPRIASTTVGVAILLVLLPSLILGGVCVVFSEDYVDIGVTRNGTQLVVGEVAWHHTIATAYRQDGIFLSPLVNFVAGPITPFAKGDYRWVDNGSTAVLSWIWADDGVTRREMVTVPLTAD